jgi:spermidine/putrescine transport system permease protein
MSTTTEISVLRGAGLTLDDIPEPKRRKRPLLPIIYWVVVGILLLPIISMIVYSFNFAPNNRVTTVWQHFTVQYYLHLADQADLFQAFLLSITIALLSAAISIAIGVPLALALERYRFWGRGLVSSILFIDIAAPSIVVGSSALSFFFTLNFQTGFWTILISHVTFNIAYAVVTLRARLSGMGTAYEQAAADLGSGPVAGFFRVTVPLLMPGILAAFLLSLAMSIDDYVITSFVAGSATTFPLYIYGIKTGLPPQVLCFGTIVFVVGIALFFANAALNRRNKV